MIYVPNLTDYQCVIIYNNQTLRAYKTMPTNNSTIDYDDYYYNSHYLKQGGTQTFNQYTSLPSCISSNELTDSYFYRNDFADILIIFVLFIICTCFPLWLIVKRFFKGKRRF